MVTQKNDFIRLCFEGSAYKDLLIKKSGMSWPPPKLISYQSVIYQLQALSPLSDDDAALPDQSRGANYLVATMDCQLEADSPLCTIPELIVLP